MGCSVKIQKKYTNAKAFDEIGHKPNNIWGDKESLQYTSKIIIV